MVQEQTNLQSTKLPNTNAINPIDSLCEKTRNQSLDPTSTSYPNSTATSAQTVIDDAGFLFNTIRTYQVIKRSVIRRYWPLWHERRVSWPVWTTSAKVQQRQRVHHCGLPLRRHHNQRQNSTIINQCMGINTQTTRFTPQQSRHLRSRQWKI